MVLIMWDKIYLRLIDSVIYSGGFFIFYEGSPYLYTEYITLSINLKYISSHVMKEDEKEDEAHFRACHENAVMFIREQYEKWYSNPYKKMSVHIINATNKENIQSVFEDVQRVIATATLYDAVLV